MVMFWWRPSSWLKPAHSPPCPQMVEREVETLWSLSYKNTASVQEASILMTSAPPKGPTSWYHPLWGLGFQHMNLVGGETHSDHSNHQNLSLCWIIRNGIQTPCNSSYLKTKQTKSFFWPHFLSNYTPYISSIKTNFSENVIYFYLL